MKTTIVLGASANPSRYSYLAVNRLIQHGYDVIAIGSNPGRIGRVQINTNFDNFQNIDTITLYINVEIQKLYYDRIVSVQPKRVIFNPGTENLELYSILEKNGIHAEIACTLVMLATNQY